MVGDKRGLVSEILYEMVGNEGIRLINILHKPATDLQLHDRTRIPITKIRTTLNILHKYNIVTYNSTRDEDRGWFKYTWELKGDCVDASVKSFLVSKLMKLKREYQEINQVDFFKCENGCIRISFTESYEGNFRCVKCNGVLKPVNSVAESRQIKREIESIKRMLKVFGPMLASLENA